MTKYNQNFHNLHFDSIQTLRGIASVLVVMEHIRFLNNGAFGVDIFFCISGFIMMFTTYNHTTHFFRKRLLRILPFYYLMTIGTYFILLFLPGLFEQTKAEPVFLLKSLLFVPFDIGNGVIQPLLRIGWTVNCEMFFYLLFGLCMSISHKYRGLLCSLLLGTLVLAGYFLPSAFAPLIFYSDPVMLDFVLGMLCYELAKRIYSAWASVTSLNMPEQSPGSFRRFGKICLLLSLLLLILLALTKHSINILSFRRLFLWGLPAMLIVLAFVIAGLTVRMPAWSVKLGDISFSLYLIHYYPILFIDRKIIDFSTLSPTSVLGAISSILLVIGLAWISWLLIEKKFTGWLRIKWLP